MIQQICRYVLILCFAIAAWVWNGGSLLNEGFISTAEAVVGRPATPVSYAGVARRTTVRVATPGLGAPGVGVQPANRGGPVNRVGIR